MWWKNCSWNPQASSWMYCRVRTSEQEREFHLQSLQQIMINLWLSYPQALALVSKCGDLGWIPWNAVQITARQASLILYKEGIYWYIAIWKSICCSPCSRDKIRVLFKMVFRLPSFYLSQVILESHLFSQCSIFCL